MHVQSGAAVPVAVTIEPNDSLNAKEAPLSSSPPPEANTIEPIVPSNTRSMEDTSVDIYLAFGVHAVSELPSET